MSSTTDEPTYDKFHCWNPVSIYLQASASFTGLVSKTRTGEHVGHVSSLLNPQSS